MDSHHRESLPDLLGAVAETLQGVPEWTLPERRWESVAAILRDLEAAIAGRNLRELQAHAADLKLSGPLRFTETESGPIVPAPEPVREEFNTLIHTLDAWAAESGG